MKRIWTFVLAVLMLFAVGCSQSGKPAESGADMWDLLADDSSTEEEIMAAASSDQNKTEQAQPEQTDPPTTETKKDVLHYAFYIRDENLYFVDNRGHGPVQLTEISVPDVYYDESADLDISSYLISKGNTLDCRYESSTGMVFIANLSNYGLYCKNVLDGSETIHIDDMAAGTMYVRYIPQHHLVYYLSAHASLYEFDLNTRESVLIEENVRDTGYLYEDESHESRIGISYVKLDGTRYDMIVGEQPVPHTSSGTSAGTSHEPDGVNMIETYSSGEQYYLRKYEDVREVVLCYWDGAVEHELYRHEYGLYYYVTASATPEILLVFPKYSDNRYEGDTVAAVGATCKEISNHTVEHCVILNRTGTEAYYLEHSEQGDAVLYKADLSEHSIGNGMPVEQNVGKMGDAFVWFDDGGVYCIKKDENNRGYLSYNGNIVDGEWLQNAPSRFGEKLIIKSKADQDAEEMTLKIVDHGKVIENLDHIGAVIAKEDALWLISEFDSYDKTGRLCIYKDGKISPLDSNVLCIVSTS